MQTETREMRLVSKLIAAAKAGDESLTQFLAVRRLPGDRWSTWDQITIDLHAITGEVITDVSLRRWASRYGIPETTTREGSAADYRKALKKVGVTLN